jgi:hypothetical protein
VSARKQHAYEVGLRIARVKELRAQLALAAAVEREIAAQKSVDAVENARHAVLAANAACVVDGQAMNLPRYELLTLLDAALAQRQQSAQQELDEASGKKAQTALENVSAKRHRECVGEHLDEARLVWAQMQAARLLEDGVELWLGHREEQT